MAHSLVYNNPGQPQSKRYDIDAAVGKSWKSKNLRDDTMLVQSLLRIFYYELGGQTDLGVSFAPPPQSTGLKVDGYIGPLTQSHIEIFLNQLAMSDPVPGRLNDHAFDPLSKMVVHNRNIFLTALLNLNDFCFDGPGLRSMPLEARASDPEVVPPLLAHAITRIKVY